VERELGLAAQLVASAGIHVAERPDCLAYALPGVLEATADDRLERMEAELEARNDAEVAAAAAEPPEQLGVLLVARANDLARGSDQLGGGQIVASESVLGGEVADAAAEGEAGDPG